MFLLLLEISLEDPVLFYSSDAAHINVQSSYKSDEDTIGDNYCNCEHETHQSLINNELMTVMDCRNCREIGETNGPELEIHSPTLFQGHCFVA